MAYLAVWKATLNCPGCGHVQTRPERPVFSWGYCGDTHDEEVRYSLGADIAWRLVADEPVRPWTSFELGGGANIGDPAIGELSLRLREEWSGDPWTCLACSGGIAVRISGGRISSIECAWHEHDAALEDGRWVEHPEWEDHPLATHRGTPLLVLVAAESLAKQA